MKAFIERVCIGIKVLGYGLIIHSVFIFERFGQGLTTAEFLFTFNEIHLRDGQLFYLIACLVVPIFLRWMLTGKLRYLPVVSKQEDN